MMHKTNNYCDIQDGCKIVKRLEAEKQKLKQSNNEKNDLLQKLGISATGEFKRIKYYIDKLVAENDRLKRYKDSKQARNRLKKAGNNER